MNEDVIGFVQDMHSAAAEAEEARLRTCSHRNARWTLGLHVECRRLGTRYVVLTPWRLSFLDTLDGMQDILCEDTLRAALEQPHRTRWEWLGDREFEVAMNGMAALAQLMVAHRQPAPGQPVQ